MIDLIFPEKQDSCGRCSSLPANSLTPLMLTKGTVYVCIMLHCAPHYVDISHWWYSAPSLRARVCVCACVSVIVVSVDLLCYSSHIPLDQSSHSLSLIVLISLGVFSV